MFKRGFKRALTWVSKNRNFNRSRKQSDCRIVAAAVRMTRELARTNPALTGIHPTCDRPSGANHDADPGDIMAENNAEVDRVCVQHAGRQLAQTRHYKKVVFFRAEGRC